MKLIRAGVFIVCCSVGLLVNSVWARLSDGLVAYYPFDGNVADSTTNVHHGTEHGGLGYTNGIIGSAIDLDGTNDYITVPDAEDLRMQDDFSLAIWIRSDEIAFQYIVMKMGDIDGSNYTFVMYDTGILGGHFENPSGLFPINYDF